MQLSMDNDQTTMTDAKPGKNTGRFRYFAIGCLGIAIILAGLLIASGIYFAKKVKSLREVRVIEEVWDNSEYVNALRNLELVERESTETISKTETPVFNVPWWGELSPSTAQFEVRFKVKYVYFISAERDKWKFEFKDGVCYLGAPPLQARTSVMTNTIEGRVNKGWLVPGEEKKLRELEKSASTYANSRALDRKHISVVRESCRKSLEDFMYNWFARGNSKVKMVKIRFSDEGDEVFHIEK